MHKRDLRLIAKFAWITPSNDPFRDLVQHDALIGHEKNAGELVSHDHHCDSKIPTERKNQLVELDRGDRIESGRRLIKKQEIRLEHQGARNARALLHATRNFTGQVFGEGPESNEVELCLNELTQGGTAYRGPCTQRKRKILCERKRAKQCAGLEEHSEGRYAFVVARLSDTINMDSSRLGLFEPNQMSKQRALSAA